MKYKVYVDWLTQWGKDYLSHLKQIFQGKLTAGEGVTIDENNTISTDGSFDDYMLKENPVGSGYFGMNLPTNDNDKIIYPGRFAMVGGKNNKGTGQYGLTVGSGNENTQHGSIVCGAGNEIKSNYSITCGSNNQNPANGSGTSSIMAGAGNSNKTRHMIVSGSNNTLSYNGFGNGVVIGSENSSASPHSTIFGDNNTINANSQYVALIGKGNTAKGNNNMTAGFNNTVTGGDSKVIGDNNITDGGCRIFGDGWTESNFGGYLIGNGCNLDDIAARVSVGGNILFGVGGNVVAGLKSNGELNLGFGLDHEEDLSGRVINIIEYLHDTTFRYKSSIFKDGRMKGADPINNDEFTTKQFVESYFEFLDNYSEERF